MNYAIRSIGGYLLDTGADSTTKAEWCTELGDDCFQFDERADAQEIIDVHFSPKEIAALNIRVELVEPSSENADSTED